LDDRRFDALVRRLSSDLTRRRVVGLFGGAALGAMLAAGVGGDASAARKKQCVGGCGVCERCKRGKCKPNPGAACDSGGTCLTNGSCAIACTADDDCPSSCSGGCSYPNAEGKKRCVQAVDCQDIPQNCRSTKACPVGQQCQTTPCYPGKRCYPVCSA
jgi:hypothetical protein